MERILAFSSLSQLLSILLFLISNFEVFNADLTNEQKAEYLRAHNKLRLITAWGKTPNQPPAADMCLLSWDDDLAEIAQRDADTCRWEHTTVDLQPKFAVCGQNMMKDTKMDPTEHVQMLYDEVQYYNYRPLVLDDLFDKTGHYTQLVSANIKFVGCGHARCNATNFIHCNYGNAGNLLRSYPYKNGTACTKCRPDAPWCYNKGLCATKEQCDVLGGCTCDITCENGGVVDPETCTCQCSDEWKSFFCDTKCEDSQRWCSWISVTCTDHAKWCKAKCGLCGVPPTRIIQKNENDIRTDGFDNFEN